jgi:hypothetical protein
MNYAIEYTGLGSMNTKYEDTFFLKTPLDWNRPQHAADFMVLVHFNLKKLFSNYKITLIYIEE